MWKPISRKPQHSEKAQRNKLRFPFNKNVHRLPREPSPGFHSSLNLPCLEPSSTRSPSESVTFFKVSNISLPLFSLPPSSFESPLIRGRAYLGISFGSKLLTLDTSVVNSPLPAPLLPRVQPPRASATGTKLG